MMSSQESRVVLGAAIASMVVAGVAHGADQILFSAFSGAQTTESFEGFVAGPNIPESSFGPAYLVPGSVSAFDFGSGVSLTSPIPNTTVGGVLIADFNRGPASWAIAPNGVVASDADVPSGTAYLGANGSSSMTELTFDTPQSRVGAFVTAASATITMEAFDSCGISLGTAVVDSVVIADWGTNFLGLQDATGITKITISADFTALDNLVFEIVDTSCPGDADGNGTVNFDDINSVLMHWLESCP